MKKIIVCSGLFALGSLCAMSDNDWGWPDEVPTVESGGVDEDFCMIDSAASSVRHESGAAATVQPTQALHSLSMKHFAVRIPSREVSPSPPEDERDTPLVTRDTELRDQPWWHIFKPVLWPLLQCADVFPDDYAPGDRWDRVSRGRPMQIDMTAASIAQVRNSSKDD